MKEGKQTEKMIRAWKICGNIKKDLTILSVVSRKERRNGAGLKNTQRNNDCVLPKCSINKQINKYPSKSKQDVLYL